MMKKYIVTSFLYSLFLASAFAGNHERLLAYGNARLVNEPGNNSAFYKQVEHEYAPGPNDKAARDSAQAALEKVNNNGTWINSINENATISMPFGITKTSGGVKYELAVAKMFFSKFGPTARVFARCVLPQRNADGENKMIYFAGSINLSRIGGVSPTAELQLIGDDAVSIGDNIALVLKGSGSNEKPSTFKFDCNGFTSLDLNCAVELSNQYFTPLKDGTDVIDPARKIISNNRKVTTTAWNELMLEDLAFPVTFKVAGIKSFNYEIQNAILDLSDKKNPTVQAAALTAYIKVVQPVLSNTWKGLWLQSLRVILPKEFRKSGSGKNIQRVTLGATFGAVDENGFACNTSAKNVYDLTQGDANGWKSSLEKFSLSIRSSQVDTCTFSGRLLLPLEKRPVKGDNMTAMGIAYEGHMVDNENFEITGGSMKSIKADIWKANLELDRSSALTMKAENGVFKPSVSLSGTLGFSSNGKKEDPVLTKEEAAKSKKNASFSIEDVSFEELVLQTEKPYLSVKAMGAASQLEIGGFKADISVELDTKAESKNADGSGEYATLTFDADVQLMKGKIGGKTKLKVTGVYDEGSQQWKYESTKLESIAVNADFGKVAFDGAVDFFDEDPTYGKGFAGKANLKVSTIKVGGSMIFGAALAEGDSDPYRYWSVDANVRGLKIMLNGVMITGFSGGASYLMDPMDPKTKPAAGTAKFASDVKYVPNNNSFLRVRAGVFLNIASEYSLSGWAGLEMAFNRNWGVDEMVLSGNAQMLSAKGVDKNTSINATSKSGGDKPAQPSDAFLWGNFVSKLDLKNERFTFNINVYGNYKGVIYGNLGRDKIANGDILVSSSDWHVYVGTQKEPGKLRISTPLGDVDGSAYFQMGNDIKGTGNADFALKYGVDVQVKMQFDAVFFYARFNGRLAYDLMVIHKQNLMCNGREAGIYGWFGTGQVRADLSGSAGVKIPSFSIFGISYNGFEKEVFNAGINALLNVRGPSPFYAAGRADFNYKVGISVFSLSGSFKTKFQIGDYCDPMGVADTDVSNDNLLDAAKNAVAGEAKKIADAIARAAAEAARIAREAAEAAARAIAEAARSVVRWFSSWW